MSRKSNLVLANLSILSTALLWPNQSRASLYFSEYVESTRTALEIANSGAAPVDLSQCEVVVYDEGEASIKGVTTLVGNLPPSSVHVLCYGTIDTPQVCNQITTTNDRPRGDLAVALRCGDDTLDVIGRIGENPGREWGLGNFSTRNDTLCRRPEILQGDPNGSDPFKPRLEWFGWEEETVNTLGSRECEFNPGQTVECNETGIVTIGSVQGRGKFSAASFSGEEKTVRGTVTAVAPDDGGFYLQNSPDEADSDPVTSDAIWVFNPNGYPDPRVQRQVGDRVVVQGTVTEESSRTSLVATGVSEVCEGTPGNIPFTMIAAQEMDKWERYEHMLVFLDQSVSIVENTQLESNSRLVVSTQGPPPKALNDVFFWPQHLREREAQHESSLFEIDDLSGDKHLFPAQCGSGGLNASSTQPCRIGSKIDPSHAIGPLDQDRELYRIRDLDGRIDILPDSNLHPRPTAAPDIPGATLRMASMNLNNYFVTLDVPGQSCGPSQQSCLGAKTELERERQASKLIAALLGLNADVIALQELENPVSGTPFADWAVSDLVNRINLSPGRTACSGGNYKAVDPGEVALGDKVTQSGLIYCDQTVSVAATDVDVLDDSDLDTLNLGGLSGVFDGQRTSHAVLGAKMIETATGTSFTVVAADLKSRTKESGTCETSTTELDCTASNVGYHGQRRNEASQAIVRWLQENPVIGTQHQIVLGGINAYTIEAPVTNFVQAGFYDLWRLLNLPGTTLDDGRIGALDRAFVNESLSWFVAGAQTWTINTQEPSAFDYISGPKGYGNDMQAQAASSYFSPNEFRSSDRNPLVVGLCLDGSCQTIRSEINAAPAPVLGGLGYAALGVGLFGLGGLSSRRRRSLGQESCRHSL